VCTAGLGRIGGKKEGQRNHFLLDQKGEGQRSEKRKKKGGNVYQTAKERGGSGKKKQTGG